MNISYKKITTGIRPLKLAVLFNVKSGNWRPSVDGIIELFSCIWGGRYNIIVPTDGNIIEDCFLQILKAFDPDILYYYQDTTLDEIYFNDDSEEKENAIRSVMNRLSISKSDAERYLKSDILRLKCKELNINEHFFTYVQSHLSCFSPGEKKAFPKLYRRSNRSLGTLKIEDYLAEICQHTGTSPFYYNFDNCSEDVRLLLSSYTGSGKFVFSGRADIPIERIDDVSGHILLRHLYTGQTAPMHPFGISGYGLSETLDFYHVAVDVNPPFCVLIVGAAGRDYALFYSLCRLMYGVYWIPSIEAIKESSEGLALTILLDALDNRISTGTELLKVSSCSLKHEELQAFVSEIRKLSINDFTEGGVEIQIVTPDQIGIKMSSTFMNMGIPITLTFSNSITAYLQILSNHHFLKDLKAYPLIKAAG